MRKCEQVMWSLHPPHFAWLWPYLMLTWLFCRQVVEASSIEVNEPEAAAASIGAGLVDSTSDRLMRRQKQPAQHEDTAFPDSDGASRHGRDRSAPDELHHPAENYSIVTEDEDASMLDGFDAEHFFDDIETSAPLHLNGTEAFSFEEFDPLVDHACEVRQTSLVPYEGNLLSLVQHDIACPSGKHLTGFYFTRANTVDKLMAKYSCCKLVGQMGSCSSKSSTGRADLGGALPALQNHEPDCNGNGLLREWKLNSGHGQLTASWQCCAPPSAQKIGGCVTAETRKETLTGSVLRLVSHPVKCTAGRALLNWKFKNDGRGQFNIQYTCCAIGAEPAPAGPTRWCTWGGDPHFVSFDGRRHDTTRVGYGQTFWAIRSKDVQAQYFAQGSPTRYGSRPGLTRGLAVGGKFIKGHRVIVRKDVPCLTSRYMGSVKGSYSTWSGFRTCSQYEWSIRRRRIKPYMYIDNKYVSIPSSGRTSEPFPGAKISHYWARRRRGYSIFTVDLPWRIQIKIWDWSYYFNVHIRSPHLPEQNGQCGDNNGRSDPWLQDTYPVSAWENMFNYGNEVRGTSKAGAGGGNKEPALAGCTGTKRQTAEATCNSKVASGQVENEFLHICLFDLCFSDAGAGLAGTNMEMAQETERQAISNNPREYKLLTGTCVGTALGQGNCACPTGKQLGKISSQVDQDAIVEAIVESVTTPQVWLGGRFVEGIWRWGDGSSLTGFSNWDPSVNWRSPAGKRLCIDRGSGFWKPCADNEQLNVICEDKKAFTIVGEAAALESRYACGPNHEMAMPKSVVEMQSLWSVIEKAGKDAEGYWLGAKYTDGEWLWDDGSKVGEFGGQQWGTGQPAYDQEKDNFLCVDGATGRWKVCAGYDMTAQVACQTSRAGLRCPVPQLTFRQVGLTKFPMEGFSLFRGECYYIGRGDRSCHETCWQQVQGTCNQKGLIAAAQTKSACKMVVGKFGHLDSSSVVEVPGGAGCTWKDLGMQGDKTITQAVLEVSDAPTSCGATTSSEDHHRICSCDKSVPDAMKYPSAHVMTAGETVRVQGAGYDMRKSFSVKLLEGAVGEWDEGAPAGGFLQLSRRADERYSLVFDPTKKEVTRKYIQKGKAMQAKVTWWALGPANEAWAIDLQMAPTEFQVMVNGKRYPELDLLRDPSVKVTDVSSQDVLEAVVMYFPQPAAAGNLPISFDSRNGCDDHPFTLDSAAVVTIHARLYFHSAKNMPCIRCEDSLVTEGNHFFVKEGKLSVAFSQAVPKMQSFQYLFTERLWYEVAVSYVAKDKVVELYIDEQRVEVLYFTTAPALSVNRGQLGCAGPDTDRQLEGKIEDFTMTDLIPPYRPVTGWCHELGALPEGKVLKKQAQLIPCKGAVCRPDTDLELCTEDRSSCGVFNCPRAMVKKAEADLQGFLCVGPQCQTHECCLSRAGCETLVCGTGKVLKKDAADILCSNTRCADADKDVCCDDLGKCSAFSCPAGYINKDNAANIFCTDRACNLTDYETCCQEPAVCGNFRCPSGYVAANNASDRVCEGGRCLATRDLPICCEPVAFCNNYVCPDVMVPVDDATARCQSHTCTKADEAKCCLAAGTCNQYKCPDGETHRANASDILCHDRLCQNTNHTVCCEKRATCESLACPVTHIKKDMPKSIQCMGASCSLASDLDTCCEVPASCSTATCPLHYVLMHNASNLTCQKGACVAADSSTCCVKQGSCLSMTCPAGKIHSLHADTTTCIDSQCGQAGDEELCCDDRARCGSAPCGIGLIHIHDANSHFCKAQICTEDDNVNCCAGVGNCTSMQCPEGQTHRVGAAGLACEDETCQLNEANLERCCVARARCDTLQCRWDYVPAHNASEVMCLAETCSDADDHDKCCVREDLCSGFKCPSPDYVLRGDAHEIYCEGEPPCRNTTENMHLCCEHVAVCSELVCPEEGVLKPAPDAILCAGSTCKVDVDANTCCDMRVSCDNLTCSQGLIKRHNASVTLCDGTDCSTTNELVCCAELGQCSTRPCESGFIHKVSSERIMCAGDQCATQGAAALIDRGLCCEPLAVCDPGICNSSSHIGRRDASSRYCSTQRCGPQDVETCCTERAKCSSSQCPKNYVQVPDADSKYCQDLNCQEQDFDQCCLEQARCDTYACPTGELHMYVSRPNGAAIFCAGSNCTYIDRDTCCARRPACDTLECPATYVHVAEAATLFCSGEQCETSEIGMCCDELAVCSTFACPSGYRPRGGSSQTFCAGSTCSEAKDLSTCCESFGHCSAFKCPSATVARTSYDSCPSVSLFCGRKPQEAVGNQWCDAADSMTCMSIFGYTAALPDSPSMSILCKWENNRCQRDFTAACPMNPVAVAAACNGSTEILCDNERCTTEECCAPVAKCNTYTCPHGTIFAPNAASINCQARECDARDAQACCQDLSLCKTEFTCPQDYVHRANASDLFCHDPSCLATDFHHCCEPQAHCASMTCPQGYVPTHGADRKMCQASTCTETDLARCCEQVASCQAYPSCPAGTERTANPAAMCAGRQCEATDEATCCVAAGRCDTLSCPDHYVHRSDAAQTWCTDRTCEHTDFNLCCVEAPFCVELACPSEYVRVPGAGNLHCEGLMCTPEADLHTCCQPRATCNVLACPQDEVQIAAASTTLCAGANCNQSIDAATCCVPEGHCHSLACPPQHVHHKDADKRYCFTTDCSGPHDSERCCSKRAACGSFSCSHVQNGSFYLQKPNTSDWLCASFECGLQDVGLCCDERDTCLDYACPMGYLRRNNSGQILCADAKCRESDYRTCCEPAAMCSTLQCPLHYVPVPEASSIACHGLACQTEVDLDRCCHEQALCSTAACPAGYIQKPQAEELYCEGSHCKDTDAPVCCAAEIMCSSFRCPENMVQRPFAHTIACDDFNCSVSQNTTCCAEKGVCDSLPCPGRMVHKADAASRRCQEEACSTSDEEDCCEVAAMCNTMVCPSDYEHVPIPEEVRCHGAVCCETDDLTTCCRHLGFCESYQCPQGYAQRHNASSISCEGGACGGHVLSAVERCCVVERSCISLQCPVGFEHRRDAEHISCRQQPCNFDDRFICCKPMEGGNFSSRTVAGDALAKARGMQLPLPGFWNDFDNTSFRNWSASKPGMPKGVTGMWRNGTYVQGKVNKFEQFIPGKEQNGEFIPGKPDEQGNWIEGLPGPDGEFVPGKINAEGHFVPDADVAGFWNEWGGQGYEAWKMESEVNRVKGQDLNGAYVQGIKNTKGQFIPGIYEEGVFRPGMTINGSFVDGELGPDGRFIPGIVEDGVFHVGKRDCNGHWLSAEVGPDGEFKFIPAEEPTGIEGSESEERKEEGVVPSPSASGTNTSLPEGLEYCYYYFEAPACSGKVRNTSPKSGANASNGTGDVEMLNSSAPSSGPPLAMVITSDGEATTLDAGTRAISGDLYTAEDDSRAQEVEPGGGEEVFRTDRDRVVISEEEDQHTAQGGGGTPHWAHPPATILMLLLATLSCQWVAD